MEEQRKRKALMSCREGKAMAEFEEAISQIVGLQELKMQLHRWARGMLFDEKRRAMGLGIASRRAPHMAFVGNPGTGKYPQRSHLFSVTKILFSLIIKSMIIHPVTKECHFRVRVVKLSKVMYNGLTLVIYNLCHVGFKLMWMKENKKRGMSCLQSCNRLYH